MADRSAGCFKKVERKRGPWTFEEDIRLISYITFNGEGRWEFLAKASGLNRSGRSCRLRWVNYLSPDLNHTSITAEEERLIIDLHARWGNRWSRIAESLPGRTDNGIKNYWKTHLKKKIQRQENGESKAHCESSTRSSEAPIGLERVEKAEEHTAISSFRANAIAYKNNEFESEVQNPITPALANKENSTDFQWKRTEKAKEPCMVHITEAQQHTEISSFNRNPISYMINEYESQAQNSSTLEGYSTDLDYNLSGEFLSSELYRNSKVGYSLHNNPSPEALSNKEFYSDELWNHNSSE
ncbi:hypothetical protein SUGI_0027990 [Cryptomeria japonica]|uniref:myb-related protein 305-like n=1 Tax=Cryptomeria japonica TaxID=3369 RepID=UPI002408AFE1|nr:myb-related protein 305-like [Cryptomeria japonica]GLJ05905.1 hypothetical protein SUGI_0027990 [Cryptomeria japonica]